jgi:hypothetical protein
MYLYPVSVQPSAAGAACKQRQTKSVAAGETLKRENQNRTNEYELVKIGTGALTEI